MFVLCYNDDKAVFSDFAEVGAMAVTPEGIAELLEALVALVMSIEKIVSMVLALASA